MAAGSEKPVRLEISILANGFKTAVQYTQIQGSTNTAVFCPVSLKEN